MADTMIVGQVVGVEEMCIRDREMKISERTVKNHISSIFKKLEVTDRTPVSYTHLDVYKRQQ